MEIIAPQNLTEIKLSYINPTPVSERIKILSAAKAVEYFRAIWDAEKMDLQEEFKVIYMNNSLEVLGHYNCSLGSIGGCDPDIRLILAAALKVPATRLILAHNHPSGNIIPSKQDLVSTQKIKEIGSLLEIFLFDHIILTSEKYYSMADNEQL